MNLIYKIRLLLYPFSILYDFITSIRNFGYDRKIIPSVKFDLPVVCVGNLSVGGTGKSTFVIYLLKFLSQNFKPAVISRGYKRKTYGFVLVNDKSTATEVGDEPVMIKNLFPHIPVGVSKNRMSAIPEIISYHNETDVVIMDDGFQHRQVNPSIKILLTEYDRPFFDDFILPAGNLRENRSNAQRADIIIVTKCPAHINKEKYRDKIQQYSANIVLVFFMKQKINNFKNTVGNIIEIGSNKPDCVLVSGIANSAYFKNEMDKIFNVHSFFDYPDHYKFEYEDFEKWEVELKKIISNNKYIVTTFKDVMRILCLEEIDFKNFPIIYPEIEFQFMYEPHEAPIFEEYLLQLLKKEL